MFLIHRSSAAYFAAAMPQEVGAHAVTLNAYMGVDTVKPFITDPAKGVFVLCKVQCRPHARRSPSVGHEMRTARLICGLISRRGWHSSLR